MKTIKKKKPYETLVFVRDRNGEDCIELIEYSEVEDGEDYIRFDISFAIFKRNISGTDKIVLQVDENDYEKDIFKCL